MSPSKVFLQGYVILNGPIYTWPIPNHSHTPPVTYYQGPGRGKPLGKKLRNTWNSMPVKHATSPESTAHARRLFYLFSSFFFFGRLIAQSAALGGYLVRTSGIGNLHRSKQCWWRQFWCRKLLRRWVNSKLVWTHVLALPVWFRKDND